MSVSKSFYFFLTLVSWPLRRGHSVLHKVLLKSPHFFPIHSSRQVSDKVKATSFASTNVSLRNTGTFCTPENLWDFLEATAHLMHLPSSGDHSLIRACARVRTRAHALTHVHASTLAMNVSILFLPLQAIINTINPNYTILRGSLGKVFSHVKNQIRREQG